MTDDKIGKMIKEIILEYESSYDEHAMIEIVKKYLPKNPTTATISKEELERANKVFKEND